MSLKSVCVFCGSNSGNDPRYVDVARAVGKLLATRDVTLVYGGGRVGMMGAVADAALAAGGKVIGVIPELLVRKEVAHPGCTELQVVSSMHERKQRMADQSDGFIAMPGGFGTFEEFCEILTWAQLGLHRKPCGLLNAFGYYAPLLQMFDQAKAEGFLLPHYHALVLSDAEHVSLLDKMMSYRAPELPALITSQST